MEFKDLKTQYNLNKKELDYAIQNVINDTSFIGGKEVARLEKRLADYVGVKHCITCGNGTDAMSLVLMAWDIGEGDAVFVPDFTFFATAEVVSLQGATPVFVDVDKDSFNIDPVKLESKIKKVIEKNELNPKVIIPVDLFGLPANYYEIDMIAKKYNLKILEDGAQGFGGSIKDNKTCSFGDAATTSFFPAKPLGCYGDGGAIFTNDDKLATLLDSLKVHGKGNNKYDNVRIGMNSRLDSLQATILNVKLTVFIDHELSALNKAYEIYNDKLHDVVKKPKIPKGFVSSFAQYTIRLNNKEERDNLQTTLKKHNIPSMIYYIKPLHKQKAFKQYDLDDKDFPNTNELCHTVLSLPMHPYLSKEEIETVARTINEYV